MITWHYKEIELRNGDTIALNLNTKPDGLPYCIGVLEGESDLLCEIEVTPKALHELADFIKENVEEPEDEVDLEIASYVCATDLISLHEDYLAKVDGKWYDTSGNMYSADEVYAGFSDLVVIA